MSEIETAQQLMSGKFGWYAAISAWMLNCRIVAKLFSSQLQGFLTKLLASSIKSKDAKIDGYAQWILGWMPYRISSWIVDTIFSIKLPTLALYTKAKELNSGDTQIIEKTLSDQ